MTVTVVTEAGTDAHEIFCDAFLLWGGYVLVNDGLWRAVTMWGAGVGRVEWRLAEARHAGRA